MSKARDDLKRAYRQVLGYPKHFPTEAHLMVYKHMKSMSEKPASRKNMTEISSGELCPYETMAQTAVRDYQIAMLKLADSKPADEKQETKIKT